MTLVVPEANIILAAGTDKLGHLLNRLRLALVATGLWEVTGSGDGGALVQNQGQTSGEGGSFDLFAPNPTPVHAGDYQSWYNAMQSAQRSLSRPYAWLQLKEKGSTRTIQFKRAAQGWGADGSYSDTFAMRIAPGGVKPSGATPTNAPQANTGTSEWLQQGANPSTSFSVSPIFWSGAMRWWTQTSDVVMQLFVSTDARAKGVCPWAILLADRDRNAHVGGMFYESLVDAQPADQHPYIFRSSDTGSNTWGVLVGKLGSEAIGPFHEVNISPSYQYGVYGENCKPWLFEVMCVGDFDKGSNSYRLFWPGNVAHPLDADGKWRTFAPRVRLAAGKYAGRSEHLLANLGMRDYPTTYNLASSAPRIAAGQLLFPWPSNVVPLMGR